MKYALKGFCLVLLACAVFAGCTDGEFSGSGGGGNFNIVDRTDEGYLNGKWIWVEGLSTGGVKVGFSPSFARKQLKGRKLSAPLYNLDTGDIYAGSDSFSAGQFTVKAYNTESAPNPETGGTKTFQVLFYNGSGLIDWK
ncbi:MAG: hypothetical protein FWH38_06225 [Treponema sp.]|nr:hypothetical protein [Treponema sp.]